MIAKLYNNLRLGTLTGIKSEKSFRILREIGQTYTQMALGEHLRYWLFPFIAVVTFMFFYYTGSAFLCEIIAPSINREFGLNENTQNAFLLLAAAINLPEVFRSVGIWRTFHLGAALLFLFLFAEELDYGLHWYEYINGIPHEAQTEVRNIHNQGRILEFMRFIGNLTVVGIAIFPYFYKGDNALIRQLMPSKRMIFTVITFILITRIAYLFVSLGFNGNGALHDNRAEFEEIVIYYIFLTYFQDLIQRKRHSTAYSA